MSMRVWLVGIVSLACVVAVSSALASREAEAFKVTSTLDGKRVLPARRILWLAFPKPRTVNVTEVEFLIDGKVRWVERIRPYCYGCHDDPDNYLVTSWLTPGRHQFTVRATATDGRKATNTAVARVHPAPSPAR